MNIGKFLRSFFLVVLLLEFKTFGLAVQNEISKKIDIFENSMDTNSKKLLAARDRARGGSSVRPMGRSGQSVRSVQVRPVRARSVSLPEHRTINPRPRVSRSEGTFRAPKPLGVSGDKFVGRREIKKERKSDPINSPRIATGFVEGSKSISQKESRVRSRLSSERKGIQIQKEARNRDWRANRNSQLRQGHTGFALRHGKYAGLALGHSLKNFRHPDHRYWGSRHYFRNLGFWYYPSWGFWYYPDFYCWYYPWSRSWFFYDWNYWYYPVFSFSIYLANEKRRIVFLDNDSDDDLFYAVYLRRQIDDEYFLYRVDEPLIIQSHETAKVYLPRDKNKEYIVLAEKNEKELPENMVQDESGNAKQASEEAAQTDSQEQRNIKIESLSKKEISKLNEIKNKVYDKKQQLEQKSSEIEDIKDPDAQIEQDTQDEEED